ncbi:MAG: type II toxin-antitoxin system VapC family toxin [Steroidobacteraceae bacterium]
MILVDTSVWIDHFRGTSNALAEVLERGEVLMHPFVVGELACGSLKDRSDVLDLLQQLPSCVLAEHEEVLMFIETRKLFGRGIGYVDAHLLASAAMQRAALWTRDRRLQSVAGDLNLAQ